METAALLLLWQLWGMGNDEPWKRYQPPIFAAEGGRIKKKEKKEEKDDDFDVIPLEGAQFFVPTYDPKGKSGWPKIPAPDVPGQYESVAREIRRQQAEESERRRTYNSMMRGIELGTVPKVNPQAWDNFIANTPRSTNIEDRRTADPTMQGDVSIPSHQEGGRAVYQ